MGQITTPPSPASPIESERTVDISDPSPDTGNSVESAQVEANVFSLDGSAPVSLSSQSRAAMDLGRALLRLVGGNRGEQMGSMIEQHFGLYPPHPVRVPAADGHPRPDLSPDTMQNMIRARFNELRRNVGASEEAIIALESVPLSELSEGDDQCLICMEPYDSAHNEAHDASNGVLRMPCGHVFGGRCLGIWLEVNYTCPVCRAELPSNEPQEEMLQVSLRHDAWLPRWQQEPASELDTISIDEPSTMPEQPLLRPSWLREPATSQFPSAESSAGQQRQRPRLNAVQSTRRVSGAVSHPHLHHHHAQTFEAASRHLQALDNESRSREGRRVARDAPRRLPPLTLGSSSSPRRGQQVTPTRYNNALGHYQPVLQHAMTGRRSLPHERLDSGSGVEGHRYNAVDTHTARGFQDPNTMGAHIGASYPPRGWRGRGVTRETEGRGTPREGRGRGTPRETRGRGTPRQVRVRVALNNHSHHVESHEVAPHQSLGTRNDGAHHTGRGRVSGLRDISPRGPSIFTRLREPMTQPQQTTSVRHRNVEAYQPALDHTMTGRGASQVLGRLSAVPNPRFPQGGYVRGASGYLHGVPGTFYHYMPDRTTNPQNVGIPVASAAMEDWVQSQGPLRPGWEMIPGRTTSTYQEGNSPRVGDLQALSTRLDGDVLIVPDYNPTLTVYQNWILRGQRPGEEIDSGLDPRGMEPIHEFICGDCFSSLTDPDVESHSH